MAEIAQTCNHGEIFGATSAMVGQNLSPPGWNRITVSENLGATAVAPVAPAVTPLHFLVLDYCILTAP